MEEALSKALAFEKKYDWLEARDLYEHALGVVDDEDFLKRGEVQERIGLCLHRAAFQAESQEGFRQRLGLAVEAYERACAFYEKLGNRDSEARVSRCRALGKYLQHWLVSDPSEKRKLLDECLELIDNSFSLFWDLGQKAECGVTYGELPRAFVDRFFLEWDGSTAKKILEQGIALGERAIEGLSELGDSYLTARAENALAVCLLWFYDFIPDPEKQEECISRAVKYLGKAPESFERAGDEYLLGLSHLILGSQAGGEQRSNHFEKALVCGENTRDNFLKASAIDWQAFVTRWKGYAAVNPDARRNVWRQSIELHDRAQRLFSIMSLISPRRGVIAAPMGHAEDEYDQALLETDLEKRLELLKRAAKIGLEGFRVAEDSGVPRAVQTANHVLSKTLAEQARLVPDVDEKRQLLERALVLRKTSIEGMEELAPFLYYDRGLFHCYLAQIKAGLAGIESNPESRKKLFEEAVLWMEKGLNSMGKIVAFREKKGRTEIFAPLMAWQYRCGVLLDQLFKLTSDPEYLTRAIDVWQRAIELGRKLDLVSRIAECHWSIGQARDSLGENTRAAASYQHASDSYRNAAEKIPQLKDFYQDYASYMQAWSEIEKAKQLHGEKQYGTAKEHYEAAAEIHRSTRQWSHLSSNYLAWARLEDAEDLSRKEKTEEARDAFEQAAGFFTDAKHDMMSKLALIQAGEERESAEELARVSDQRREYCLSRALLEDARVSAGQGASAASGGKYSASAEMFEKLLNQAQQEAERRELRPIASLCHAWGRMMQAEETLSPSMYREASELFAQAVKDATDQQTRMLAQANSYTCKAIEVAAGFEATRDPELFFAAKKHLEAATTQYLRAGFRTASEYSRATSKLLDAYFYMYQAQVELDQAKRAQSYQMAETMLQASAGSYIKARHPAKAEEVKRILETVREDREIAVSLSGVLKVPTMASATTGFTAPAQSHEQAVGLERFENADIQASLMPRDQEARLGDVIRLKIDLVNAGKGGAQLIKVAELLPQGFELAEKPDLYTIEDGGLNMKGKNLGPLRTEEINLILKPLDKGTFQIKPRILYLDEAGKYRSHEPEPAIVVVKELGISGWLKGPTRDK